MQRKAYKLSAGNIKNLREISENLAPPQNNEVSIEVKAIGLNFADVFAIWGLYSATPKGEFVPGLEYAGIVKAIGQNVKSVKIGDRIMGITRFGAYATHLNIDERYVIPLPEDWDFKTGAAYLVQVLTAYYGLVNLGNIQDGYKILIHSAAGGVGTLANRLAKKMNAYTIGTVGSPEKIDFCKKEGYDAVIVRGKDFAEQLDKTLGEDKINIIMECIGGEIFKIGYDRLAEEGRTVIYGSARYATRSDKPNYLKLLWQFFTRPKIDPQKMIELNKGILGFNLIYLYEKSELMHQLLQEIQELNIEKPYVGQTFAWANLPDAIRAFQGGKTIGKVVVEI